MELPSAEAEMDRYEDRPLLLVLENYILDAIGALEVEKNAGMTTLIRKIFGGDGDWRKTVREALEFDESLDDALREMWTNNQKIASEANVELHPVQFAKMCADTNFAHYFENDDTVEDESEDTDFDCSMDDGV